MDAEDDGPVDPMTGVRINSLEMAVSFGHVAEVGRRLQHGEDPNGTNDRGVPLLLVAVSVGDFEVARLLLEAGARVDCENAGKTPLWVAASDGRGHLVRLLLEQGADPRRLDNEGRLPLHLAAAAGGEEAIALLTVPEGLDAIDKYGVTPLMRAVASRNADAAVRALLDLGADPAALGNEELAVWAVKTRCSPQLVLELLESTYGLSASQVLEEAAGTAPPELVERILDRAEDWGVGAEALERTLAVAARRPDREAIVRRLLTAGANPDGTDHRSALGGAAAVGNGPVVDLLLQAGADVSRGAAGAGSPLYLAVAGGHHETAKRLLEAGAPVDGGRGDGETPLHRAAANEDIEMVELLLAAGAARELPNSAGLTASELAIQAVNIPAVKVLGGDESLAQLAAAVHSSDAEALRAVLRKHSLDDAKIVSHGRPILSNTALLRVAIAEGFDVAARSTDLLNAVQFIRIEPDLVELWLDSGFDVSARNERGRTLLDLLAGDLFDDWDRGIRYSESALLRFHKLAKRAIEAGADPDIADPLGTAISRRQTAFAEMLLDAGASPGRSPQSLLAAVGVGDAGLVRRLLDGGANPNAERSKTTALMLCVSGGDATLPIAKLLLERGADPGAKDLYGKTAYHRAIEAKANKLQALLRGAKPSETSRPPPGALASAAHAGDRNLVLSLLSQGADANETEGSPLPPLLNACKEGHVDVVELLLERGATLKPHGDAHWTPLVCAAAFGRDRVVELLLERGADPNARANPQAETPLVAAAAAPNARVLELLLRHGADPNATVATHGEGTTALHVLADEAQRRIDVVACRDCARALLGAGAEPNAVTSRGLTPLYLTVPYSGNALGSVAVARELLAAGAEVYPDGASSALDRARELRHTVLTELFERAVPKK